MLIGLRPTRRSRSPWRSPAIAILLTFGVFFLLSGFASAKADDDEIGDDEIGSSEPTPSKTRATAAKSAFDSACKQKFGEAAEHDGSKDGGCRCMDGFVPVNGKCVREGKEAMKAAYGEQSMIPLYGVAAFFLIMAILVGRWAYSQGHDESASRKKGGAAARRDDEDADEVEVAGGAARGRGGGALARMRARRQAGGDDDDDDDDDLGSGKKLGKKKLAKLDAKEEKRNMREAMEEEKARKKEKEEQRELERREADEQKARERKEKEEEERKLAEEIKRKEEEEFDKWKDMFETAEGGAQADDDLQENQGMLQEFIDYLKDNKISALDEVAAKFGLKAQEVVNRVEGLEAMGRVTGLLDDRGKFIYISADEMKDVAKWIKLQGRVSIEDLAAESNRLVDMQPRAPDPVPDVPAEGAEEATS